MLSLTDQNGTHTSIIQPFVLRCAHLPSVCQCLVVLQGMYNNFLAPVRDTQIN